MCICITTAQFGALKGGIDIEHVKPGDGENVRLRLGVYGYGASDTIATATSHQSICYDTGAANFPVANGTYDAFAVSKKFHSIEENYQFDFQ